MTTPSRADEIFSSSELSWFEKSGCLLAHAKAMETRIAEMENLKEAVSLMMVFRKKGYPQEGSSQYHQAWKQLEAAFNSITPDRP